MVTLQNQGTHYEAWNVGVLGPVTLSGLNEGKRDLSNQKWTYQIGLHGESLGVHSVAGSSSVEWGGAAGKQPLTWHKVSSRVSYTHTDRNDRHDRSTVHVPFLKPLL